MKTLHRPTITLFLGAFLAAAIAGCGSEKGKLENHLTNADGFFESGNYGAAEIEYLNAINLDNDSAEALARLGIIAPEEALRIELEVIDGIVAPVLSAMLGEAPACAVA